MKNLNKLLLIILPLALFSSCACLNNSSFSSAKYLDGQDLTRSKVKTVKHDAQAISPIDRTTEASIIKLKEEDKPIILAEAGSESQFATTENVEVPVIHFNKTTKADVAKISAAENERSERPTLKQRAADRLIKKAIERSSRRPAGEAETILLVILCFLLPPLAVYIKTDDIGLDFWISVLLTIFFWIPGIIWALYVCFIR